jgi:hypothetical protein
MLQIVASLNDDSRGIIYDCNMLIVMAIGVKQVQGKMFLCTWMGNSKPVFTEAQWGNTISYFKDKV